MLCNYSRVGSQSLQVIFFVYVCEHSCVFLLDYLNKFKKCVYVNTP